jgi:2-hydroxychromene-2-carboxylate isomerase
MDDPVALREVALQAGVPVAVVDLGLAAPDAAGLLRAEVDAAVALGVFGSPFVIADGEPFFGVDSFELLDAWIETGGW